MDTIKLDLHVHTTASPDGLNSPRAAVRAALARGLSGFAVTDHNTRQAVEAVRAVAPPGFFIISGVEYSTDCGHVLALFCEDFATGLTRNDKGHFSLAALAPFIKERGGLLVAAHPYHGRSRLPDTLLACVDGLESFNARELSRQITSRTQVESTAMAGGLFVTGGSDAHLPPEIGRCYTEFPAEAGSSGLQGLRDALASGQCTANGKPGYTMYRIISRGWKKVRRQAK